MKTLRRSLFIIFWAALMLLMCASTWAETIRLKNGRIFEGEIADESDDEVKIVMKSVIMTFSRDEIYSIGDRRISPPPPVKKPVVKKTKLSAAVASKPTPKKEQKAPVKVMEQATQNKAAQPVSLPAVAADTVTVTRLSTSTNTANSVSSPPKSSPKVVRVRPKKGLSSSAKTAIVTMAIAIIALIAFMIKRIKKQPKN